MALDTERSRVAHLLRRAGFGWTPTELDEYVALGYGAALDRLINYEFVDDSAVEARLQQMQMDTSSFEGARLLVAEPHAVHAAAAPGEDGALLAQPLRHGQQQGRATRC